MTDTGPDCQCARRRTVDIAIAVGAAAAILALMLILTAYVLPTPTQRYLTAVGAEPGREHHEVAAGHLACGYLVRGDNAEDVAERLTTKVVNAAREHLCPIPDRGPR